ncbi:hypothetical protein [Egicoccus sp. AB-alg2]|uniref:5-methylcytosine restriction system specificity protein McrC n=1 Tax=Egicoccus sp. AB-alg2 TaxID=3242693 RepID=UPI00359E2A9C
MNGVEIAKPLGAVENEWLDIRSLPSPYLIPRDQQLLSRVTRTATNRIEWEPDGRRVRFRGMAGIVSFGGGVIPVRPKFASGHDWLPALLKVAALIGRSRVRRAFSLIPGRLPASYLSPDFVDLVAWVFASDLMAALRDGPLMVYRGTVENRHALRGRLLVHRQTTQLPHQRHRLPCSFAEMSSDNEHVRLLAWSAHELMRRSQLASTRYALGQVIEALPQPQVDPTLVDTLAPLPPGANHYAGPITIARELARVRSILSPAERSITQGDHRRVASFLVDMARVFEGLVSGLYSAIARERGWSHSSQTQMLFAVRQSEGAGSNRRFLRPDDVIQTDLGVSLTSDSKYHGRVSRDDEEYGVGRLAPAVFYQLTSAMLARGTTCGLLVQPRVESLASDVADLEEWHVDSALLGDTLKVVLVRLDLRVLTEDQGANTLRAKLAEGIDAALNLAS